MNALKDERDRRPVQRVAAAVALRYGENRVPASDVGPAEAALDHRGAHDRRLGQRHIGRNRNVCRDRQAGGDTQWSAWSPSHAGFHQPASFGRLMFGGQLPNRDQFPALEQKADAIGAEIGLALHDTALGLAVWSAVHGLAMLVLENVIDLGQRRSGDCG